MKLNVLATAVVLCCPTLVPAQDVVNVYSARHYDTDDELYQKFTEQTGIEVKLLEGDSDALLARLEREAARSPADVFITVDAGRLYQAERRGLFQPVESAVLNERIPRNLRHRDGLWFGLTKRARVILYARDRVTPQEIADYEDLDDPRWRNRLLIRSSSNVYNQSLVASLIEAHGSEPAAGWCRGVVANLARRPQGGDRDQIRGVAAGEGDIAVANHYYYVQLLESDDPADRAAAARVGLLFPNQNTRGTHVNISGAGVTRSAPHRENAVKFLEFLTTPEAQAIFAAGNYEYPVVKGVKLAPVLERFGSFKEDDVSADVFGQHNAEAVRLMDRAGWR
ncbi:MAG TPA: Fe(3+) ABC transporter substrate-binding protein [Planctomycetaceae bacterium]|nr:Fe(3+) ABC transporter substrate-binding protein [Planctomycetaceae bacterium]